MTAPEWQHQPPSERRMGGQWEETTLEERVTETTEAQGTVDTCSSGVTELDGEAIGAASDWTGCTGDP